MRTLAARWRHRAATRGRSQSGQRPLALTCTVMPRRSLAFGPGHDVEIVRHLDEHVGDRPERSRDVSFARGVLQKYEVAADLAPRSIRELDLELARHVDRELLARRIVPIRRPRAGAAIDASRHARDGYRLRTGRDRELLDARALVGGGVDADDFGVSRAGLRPFLPES